MIFQGKELKIGDVLESKRHGKIQVVTLKEHHFEAKYFSHGDRRESGDWDYDGLYLCFESDGIDATWPARDISEIVAEAEKNPEDAAYLAEAREKLREREYRKVWIECAMRLMALGGSRYDPEGAFIDADAFISELRARDGK